MNHVYTFLILYVFVSCVYLAQGKDIGNFPTLRKLQGDSCDGRCGDALDPSSSCQCNDACHEFNDCCDDFSLVCGSCYGRCNAGYDSSQPCQCNDKCEEYSNCCKDKDAICGDDGTITDGDLKAIAEELLRLDDNNAGSMVQTNLQGKTNVGSFDDHASEPYFTSVEDQVWSIPTIKALLALLDNYSPDVRDQEDHTKEEQAEEDEFLSKVMETRVMKKAYEFCHDKGLFSGSLNEFRNHLKTIWFGLYDRDGNNGKTTLGSSGFEHAFIGEIKGGKVSGFHDWVHFYQLERSSNGPSNGINYLGYLDEVDFQEFGIGLSNVFTWNGDIKSYGSMFVGTSPELIMALDTICFMARVDGVCPMSLNNIPIYITTYTFKYNGNTYIGTAYPDWEEP